MAIKAHLRTHNVNEFKSVNELVNFQKNYSSIRQEIISRHSLLVEKEKKTLSEELTQLNEVIQTRRAEVERNCQLELDELRQQLALLTSTGFTVLRGVIKYLKKARLKRNPQM